MNIAAILAAVALTAAVYTTPPAPVVLEAGPTTGYLESVPLDAETQEAIFEVCGEDEHLFCMVMAIADRESNFLPHLAEGYCHGMMQIHTRWHTKRMERLGVTDLLDPVQSVMVAVDYLQELESIYGFPMYSHQILMAYNMGHCGARKALRGGVSSTGYSRDVMKSYQVYLEEMGVT